MEAFRVKMLGTVEGSEPSELSNDNDFSFMSPLASDNIAFACIKLKTIVRATLMRSSQNVTNNKYTFNKIQ